MAISKRMSTRIAASSTWPSRALDSLRSIVATWTAPTLVGVSAYPTLAVTVDEGRFDTCDIMVEGEDLITAKMSGIGMYDGTNAPFSIVYTTADTTP